MRIVQYETLSECLKLKTKEIVSVVGAGGKTSVCLQLCSEQSLDRKVALVATTKIHETEIPHEMKKYVNIQSEDEILLSEDIVNCLIADRFDGEKYGFDNIKLLQQIIKKFDILVIEADGSRRKPLKWWKENEPIIIPETTKTIGILSIKTLGMQITEENTHRTELLAYKLGKKINDFIDLRDLMSLLKYGLFSKSHGQNILLINQVDTIDDMESAKELVRQIYRERLPIDDIAIASLKNKNFYHFFIE